MADILGATTQGIQTAKTLSNAVSATSLSGIKTAITDTIGGAYDSISHGVTDAIKSISNGNIGNILSSMTSENVEIDVELPLSNVLHRYATYTAIFSIGCLDADSFNYPGSSYMAGIMPPLICKSANGSPGDRISLADGKKYDYFIDDVIINSSVAFTTASGNTTVNSAEFTIIEPYSMGMFPQAVQTAAYKQGYNNWNEATYLLTIEFKGNTETGQLVNIPNTKKFLTFNFSSLNMRVTEAGSVYTISVIPATAPALNDSNTGLKTDITIAGTTVQEVLQSGPKSLQQVVNAKYKELRMQGAVKVQDEILILFPNTAATNSGDVLVTAGKTEKNNSATQDPTLINDANLFKTLGISRSSQSSQLVQNDGTCNGLGKGKIGFDSARGGTKPFKEDNAVYDDKTKIFTQSKTTETSTATDFKFSQGSDIINAINQVMLMSDSAVAALKNDQINSAGMRPWWRIDTQVYHIQSDANMKSTGSVPKLYVYRVVPYMVHASKFLPPNAPAPGLEDLKKQAAKVYNYIYTGLNVDLLRFDIEMNNFFFTPFASDVFTKNADVVNNQNNSSGMEKTTAKSATENIAPPVGGEPATPGQPSYTMKFVKSLTSTDNKGGTRGETEATRAAKLFHDSVVDSNDMLNITCDILGDPYYISSSGSGNYTAQSTQLFNVNKDGNMDFQNGEIHFIINFRTPTDINQSTGLYDLKNTQLCQQFSGLYRLNNIRSEFRAGEFKQTLDASRIQGQDSKDTPDSSEILSTTETTQTNTGTANSSTATPASK